MNLRDYIDTNGLTFSEVGRALGEKEQTVRRYCLPVGHRDRRIPRPHVMSKIYQWSGQVVDANSFYGLKKKGCRR